MSLTVERQAFSKRLREALRYAQVVSRGPAYLAREFNLRYHGDPITAQATRKWLTGGALPSQDKARVLAQWLNVSVQWLIFGDGEARKEDRSSNAIRQEARVSDAAWPTKKFDSLNDPHKVMVTEMIHALLRLEGKQ